MPYPLSKAVGLTVRDFSEMFCTKSLLSLGITSQTLVCLLGPGKEDLCLGGELPNQPQVLILIAAMSFLYPDPLHRPGEPRSGHICSLTTSPTLFTCPPSSREHIEESVGWDAILEVAIRFECGHPKTM